jgi:hypothetical protein
VKYPKGTITRLIRKLSKKYIYPVRQLTILYRFQGPRSVTGFTERIRYKAYCRAWRHAHGQ